MVQRKKTSILCFSSYIRRRFSRRKPCNKLDQISPTAKIVHEKHSQSLPSSALRYKAMSAAAKRNVVGTAAKETPDSSIHEVGTVTEKNGSKGL
jgi:hypothetical protein